MLPAPEEILQSLWLDKLVVLTALFAFFVLFVAIPSVDFRFR
jgi:hypothetical protein